MHGKRTADVAQLQPRAGTRQAKEKSTDPNLLPEAVYAEAVLQATCDVRLIPELQQIYRPEKWDYFTTNPGSMLDGIIYDQCVQ